MMLVPLLLPPLAVAICLRESLTKYTLGVGSWWLVGIGHLFVYLPVAWFICLSVEGQLGADVVHAARNHNVKVGNYFQFIYLPAALAPLAISAGLLFFLSMNEAVISPYLCGFDRTIGDYIQKQQITGMDSGESMILGLLTAGTILVLYSGGWLFSKALGTTVGRQKSRARRAQL